MVSSSKPDRLDALERRAAEFADELTATVESVLPKTDGRFKVLATSTAGRERVTLRQERRAGFSLTVGDEPLLRLVVNYRLSWNGSQQYLAVEKSEFKIFAEGSTVPLLRFDYLRDPSPMVPSAHVNVHAHRDEVVYAMMRAGDHGRGPDRARAVAEGRVPAFRELHIPLGGHRFRPCLEDVLQMLLVEFGLDRKPGWQRALQAGRRRYRTQQLRVAATDDLTAIVDLLREMDFRVISPATMPEPRVDRLTAY